MWQQNQELRFQRVLTINVRAWGIAEKLTEQNAIQAAASVDGFSIDVNFGIGLLIGLFVWIGLSGWIVALITKLVPMPVKGALFLSQIEPEKVTPEMFQKKNILHGI